MSEGPCATPRASQRKRLVWVLGITGVVMAGEIAGGLHTRSIALLGDAFHMLTHFLAIGLSYAAVVVACRPAPPDKTYRYWRLEILAGLVNGLALVPIAGYVLYEAIRRLREPQTVDPVGTFVVALVGLVANVVCAALLRTPAKGDINLRGAFLHLVADGASSVGVLAAAGTIYFWNWTAADPLVAALISVLILVWAVSLVRASGRILMESAPPHLDLDQVRVAMKAVAGVRDVHDLHVWTITSRMHALTAHVELAEDAPVSGTEAIAGALRQALEERFEITHPTFQFEVGARTSAHCDPAHEPAGESGHVH